MNKISYTYSTKSKQLLYLTLMLFFLCRLIVMVEVKVFHIEGYQVFLLGTIPYYALIFAVISAVFLGYMMFYTTYDEQCITWHNKWRRKAQTVSLSDVRFAHFDKKGVHLYGSNSPKPGEQPLLSIPFFRMGIIEAISLNGFYESMLDNPNIRVKKEFKVLPGYTKKWRLVSLLYAALAFCIAILCLEPFKTVVVLYETFH